MKTDDMEEKKQVMKKEPSYVLWAMILTVLCFSLTFLTRRVIFSTNDDTRIMYALAGYSTGSPFPYQDFVNITLGWFISLLYTIIPTVPWYGAGHIVYLSLSMCIFFACLFKIGKRQGICIWILSLINIAYYMIVFLFISSSMQFSTSAAAMGMAGTILLFSVDFNVDTKRNIYLKTIISAICICACYALRSYSAYISICFYILTVIYQLAKIKDKNDKCVIQKGKGVGILVTSVLIIAILVPSMRVLSHYLREKASDPRDLSEYDSARVRVQDYRLFPPYEDNEDFYNSIGWDEHTYSAFLSLQFMDESMNTDSFRAMYEEYSKQTRDRFGFLGGNFKNLKKMIREILGYRVAKGLIVLSAGLFLGGTIFWIINRQKAVDGLYLLFSTAGGAALVMLFAYLGRLPIRMFLTVMIITCSSQAMAVISLSKRKSGRNDTGHSFTKVIRIVAICLFFIGIIGISAYNWRAVYLKNEGERTQTRTSATLEGFSEFERYAVANHNYIFVYDFTVGTIARDPFVVYPEEKPTNCIISGGSYTYSTPYYKQLELLGIDKMDFETLLEDRVFYVTNSEDYCERVCEILKDKTGRSIEYSVEKSFGNGTVMVLKFRFEG